MNLGKKIPPKNCQKSRGSIMSLLSKKDHDLVIEALDFYLFNKNFDMTEEKRMEINALMNWVKIKSKKTF
jgi:hypothetical protein